MRIPVLALGVMTIAIALGLAAVLLYLGAAVSLDKTG